MWCVVSCLGFYVIRTVRHVVVSLTSGGYADKIHITALHAQASPRHSHIAVTGVL